MIASIKLNGFDGRFDQGRIEQINRFTHEFVLFDRRYSLILTFLTLSLKGQPQASLRKLQRDRCVIAGAAVVVRQSLLQFILRRFHLQMAMRRMTGKALRQSDQHDSTRSAARVRAPFRPAQAPAKYRANRSFFLAELHLQPSAQRFLPCLQESHAIRREVIR